MAMDKVSRNKKSSLSKNFGMLLSKMGPLLGLVVMVLIITSNTDRFFTYNNLMNVSKQGAINAVLSIGMMLCLLSGNIDLSIGAITGISVVTMGLLLRDGGLNPYICIAAGLIVGALAGAINGLILTKLKINIPFIVTISTQNIFRGLCLVLTQATPISNMGPVIRWVGAGFIGGTSIPVVLPITAVIYIIAGIFLERTTLGRKIYAVGGNKTAADLSGIQSDKVIVFCFVASGFLAAIGGLILAGRVDAAYPLAGLGYEGDAIAAVVIGGTSFSGGRGNIMGTLIGSILIAVLRNGLNLMGVQSDLQTIVLGFVILTAVLIDIIRIGTFRKIKKISVDEVDEGGEIAGISA